MKISEKNERREFIKKSLSMGIAVGGSFLAGNPWQLFAGEAAAKIPDLVAVKNSEPDIMFNKAIEMMGGMKRYVNKNQTVVVKPNIGFNKTPEIGATTNPHLVKTIVEHCFHAGAKKVYVFDNVASSSYGIAHKCYENSGIEHAAKGAGAMVVPGDDEKYYHKKDIPGAKLLNSTKVHELVLESDVFINVPILKNHRYTYLTSAMKNLMGAVWDRMEYHSLGLDQCIADFCVFRKPDLNIVDAYRVLMKRGPQGRSPKDVAFKKTLLISEDIVAIDAAAAKIYGKDPDNIQYITHAHQLGIGNMNLNELKITKHVFS
ncbi:DUF362 domain-containing protein [Desulfobacterales bacterium HSG17]|nr:DUF362 domain-containing protein [Desulfobacterales bacterium HSG17]